MRSVSLRDRFAAARRLWARNKRGAVGVYVALSAAVTIGIAGLAVDASRAMIVHSEVQAAADAAALAGASQLDGTPTAITRANSAIANLVANRQHLASSGAATVGISSIRYLKNLPASDASPITNASVTTDPLAARFVEVTTAPLSNTPTLLRAVGATTAISINAVAVGGCHQVVCRSQPLMICNPSESGLGGQAFDLSQWRGRQVRVVAQPQGGAPTQLAPGNYGYLDPGANGTNALRDALASTAGSPVCYGLTAATSPGLAEGARGALNVRFGIYEPPGFGGNAKNNPLYAPDVNVRAMPRDNSFSGAFGNGVWNCQTYWNSIPGSSGVAKPVACTNNTNAISRYAMYQYEIAHNLSQAPPQNAANKIAGRRIIYVAVVNCLEDAFNGRAPAVPVKTYLRLFLTEPVNDPSGNAIVGEVVDVVQVGPDDSVLHDIVQLYR